MFRKGFPILGNSTSSLRGFSRRLHNSPANAVLVQLLALSKVSLSGQRGTVAGASSRANISDRSVRKSRRMKTLRKLVAAFNAISDIRVVGPLSSERSALRFPTEVPQEDEPYSRIELRSSFARNASLRISIGTVKFVMTK